jgi:hypothetical protein
LTWEVFKEILDRQEAKARQKDIQKGKTPEIRARIEAKWAEYDKAKRMIDIHIFEKIRKIEKRHDALSCSF